MEDRNYFDPRRFPVRRVGPEDAGQVPLIFRDLSPEQKQGIIASYYTSVRFLDRNVGRALDLLKTHGLEENTLVVYLADHGYSLGQHGRFEKHCGYTPALHVPLMMRWPGKIREGTVQDLTEHIDLPHTLTDLLGVKALPIRHGKSLRPYLEGRKPEARDHIFSAYLENEECFVMDARWKLIFGSGKRARTDGYETDQPKPGRYVKLFDLQKDPGEFSNVAIREPRQVARLETLALTRYRSTHPEAVAEPARLSREEALEWYVRRGMLRLLPHPSNSAPSASREPVRIGPANSPQAPPGARSSACGSAIVARSTGPVALVTAFHQHFLHACPLAAALRPNLIARCFSCRIVSRRVFSSSGM